MGVTAEELTRQLLEVVPLLECCLGSGVVSCTSRFPPPAVALGLCLAVAALSFLWARLCDNYSKVDQLWSLMPAVYAWLLLALRPGPSTEPHRRGLLVCGLVSLWSLRLTYNFWLKGGYGNLIRHEEDHRWPVLRRLIGSPALFALFNLTFIAGFQNLLLLLIALPVHGVLLGSPRIEAVDWLLAAVFLLLLCLEAAADHQHWVFQSKKRSLSPEERALHPDRDIREGFYQSGLFRFSRHPNYFAEQAMWVVVFLFSVDWAAGAAELLSPLGLGSLLLVLLFQGSMAFGEWISGSKYEAYKNYQRRTSQCIPWPPKQRDKLD